MRHVNCLMSAKPVTAPARAGPGLCVCVRARGVRACVCARARYILIMLRRSKITCCVGRICLVLSWGLDE